MIIIGEKINGSIPSMGKAIAEKNEELYRPGNSKEEFYNILQKNMQPVYDSARRQGYEIWNL